MKTQRHAPMPSTTKEQKILRLQKQRDQIQARIDKEKALLKSLERKKDTRRKIIAGALALEHADKNEGWGKTLRRLLDEYVTRPDDRELFNLAPVPSIPNPTP
jgi:hypothetical protein